ncbi:MAG: T9SS type A sorting domain-containing protein, partial [Salinivirgaceae bacterium]|nr:T9SS type A sorting domain-containing protein [Salinivirgaceae bacterium]
DQITVKDLTSITFRVDDGTSTIDGALVELDGLTLTTDINGEVTFQNVSPTTQMMVKASKEGYVSYETEINGFFTSSFAISLLADDVNEQLQIQTQISPNPAQEQVLVSCTSEIQKIRIINMAGQSVINLYCNESMEQKVSINQLERGVYLMEVETRNGKSMQKMMKQ